MDQSQHDIYQPLDKERKEIRLLLVESGSGSTTIRCQLLQAFLTSDPKPEYETISYCWGDPGKRTMILLNGERTEVPASAEAAIRTMRLADRDRVLWIDSVCINQSDVKERGHQVSIMYDIYSHNQQNLIYLGEDDGTTTRALETIEKILENARKETNQYESWTTTTKHRYGAFRYSETGLGLEIDLPCLLRFFSAPWLGRLWVAQEAALSGVNKCHFGPISFALEDVLRAAAWLKHKSPFLDFRILDEPNLFNASDLFEYCDPNSGSYSSIEGPTMLWNLLVDLKEFAVTDPRDHVFAIIGLHRVLTGTSMLTDCISPDYRSSLQTVVRDATRFVVRECADFRFLRSIEYYRNDPSADESWPSWVPHLHMRYEGLSVPLGLGFPFSAANRIDADIELALQDRDLSRLTLLGYVAGSVLHVGPVVKPEDFENVEQMLCITRGLHGLLHAHSIQYDYHTLGRTLIADLNHIRQRATEQECKIYSDWLNNLEQERALPRLLYEPDGECDENTLRLSRYHRALYDALQSRCFFVTKAGSIGLGPPTMEAGDIVAVLYGCNVPILLRSHAAYHTIQGPCYVDGIMDGEAVQNFHEQNRKEDVFIIR